MHIDVVSTTNLELFSPIQSWRDLEGSGTYDMPIQHMPIVFEVQIKCSRPGSHSLDVILYLNVELQGSSICDLVFRRAFQHSSTLTTKLGGNNLPDISQSPSIGNILTFPMKAFTWLPNTLPLRHQGNIPIAPKG